MILSIKNCTLYFVLCFAHCAFGASTRIDSVSHVDVEKLTASIQMSRLYLAKGSSWDFEFAQERSRHEENIKRCRELLANSDLEIISCSRSESEGKQKKVNQEERLTESIENSRRYLAKGSSWDFEFAQERHLHRENIARCEKELAALREPNLDV